MSNDAPGPPLPDPPPDIHHLSNLLRSLSGLPRAVDAAATVQGSGSGNDGPAAAADAPALSSTTEDAAATRRRQAHRAVLERHAGMLDGLIRSLDIVAYAQMSILYYMDNSLLRLLLRVLPHWLFFTPKPLAFPPPPRRRPYVLHVVLANLSCVLLHLFLAAPSAGEATRGYLHGGFLIDFVGERGPVSKLRLIAADLAVLVVQVVILAAVRERERLRDAMTRGGPQGEIEVGFETGIGDGQDLEAEEMGIRRDAAMELPLLEGGQAEGEQRREQHPLDRFYTGQFVVADLYIWDALRASWKENSG